MTIQLQPLVEPIPGYRLVERLGGGGFGEVWKCEAPGGLQKAIKFVHCTHDGALARQELGCLNRIKNIRHPYILSLERYEVVDGQLLIVMELADSNLCDRFAECRSQGLPGVPRGELLRYLEEAAEALDLMNIKYQLQHLDIKPQNLFLLHNHVKVADFGLVKDLEGLNAQSASGVTPLYAAPETFEGRVSRSSDQYNLAVVYEELLTGQRPFGGTNARQLMLQHATGVPDLGPLPAGDRPIIARALSKKPEDRFPTCTDLVQALRQADPTKPVNMTETPSVIPTSATPPPAAVRPSPGIARRAAAPSLKESTKDGVLFPALVIGLGGLGCQVLEHLRKDLNERCGPAEILPHIRLLAIDSDPDTTQAAVQGPDAVLTENEVFLTPLNKPSHYLSPVHNRATLDSWLNLALLCRMPRNQTTPRGLRMLGRLALVDNYRAMLAHLRSELQAGMDAKALASAARQTRLGIRTSRPRAYVIAGLGGGTGSGMFLDVAYILRHILKALGHEDPEVVGILLLPSPAPASRSSPALGNTFAALTELQHFSTPQAGYRAFFNELEEPLSDPAPPFHRCLMVQLPDDGKDPAPTHACTALVADFLAREQVTPLGRTIDDERAQLLRSSAAGLEPVCQTFGAYRYSVPRRAVIAEVGRGLVRRLVQNWLSADPTTVQQTVKTHLAAEWATLHLQPEALIVGLASAGECSPGESPESTFDAILSRTFGSGSELESSVALGALGQLEQLVGGPGEELNGPSPLAHTMAEAGSQLRRNAERRLDDLLAGLIEDPHFRIAGAEEAILQTGRLLVAADRTHRALAQEKDNEAVAVHDQIHALVASVRKGTWWPGRRTKLSTELFDALHKYPRLRCQAVLLAQVRVIYQELREQLPRLQEVINICRQRLGDFQRSFDRGQPSQRKPVDLGFGEHFLPIEARTFEDAVDTLVKAVKSEDLVALDQKVQCAIRIQFKSLAALCHNTATNFHEVRAILRQLAEDHADGLLGKASAATLYLHNNPADAEVRADLARGFEEAQPILAASGVAGPELRVLSVPNDLAGQRLAQLATAVADGARILSIPGAADVYFYREQPHRPLAELPQFGLLAEQIYRQMTASGNFTPHTRMDLVLPA